MQIAASSSCASNDSLVLLLKRTNIVYLLIKKREKSNHFLPMNGLKLLAKSEDEIDNLVDSVRVFSDDIKMEFVLPKYVVLIMDREKLSVPKDLLYLMNK